MALTSEAKQTESLRIKNMLVIKLFLAWLSKAIGFLVLTLLPI